MKYYRRKKELYNGTRAEKRERRLAQKNNQEMNNSKVDSYNRGFKKLCALYARIA